MGAYPSALFSPDLCNKKETARKNPTVSRQFYCTGDIIRIIPIRCVIRKKYSDGRPFKSHLKRISPEVCHFCIEAKMAIFSRKQCSSKNPHYAYVFFHFPKEMFCPLGASLRSAWESVRFASERSRVRIPLGPPICRIVLYDAAFFMLKKTLADRAGLRTLKSDANRVGSSMYFLKIHRFHASFFEFYTVLRASASLLCPLFGNFFKSFRAIVG